MKRIFLLLLVLSFGELTAQKVISDTEFLALGKQSLTVSSVSEKLDFLETKDHSLPLIQELEIRTETNDFDIKEQEYVVRLSPNLPHQQRAQDAFHASFIRLTELEIQKRLHQDLSEKYAQIVDYHFLPKINSDLKALEKLYQQKSIVLKQRVGSLDFDINQIIEAEEQFFKIQEDILSKEQAFNSLSKTLKSNQNIDSLKTNFVTPTQITAIISNDYAFNFLETQESQSERDLLQKEYGIEMAAIKNPLDFVQARYSARNSDPFREEFSIGLGFKLPFQGDKKMDLLELEYEQLEKQKEEITDSKEQKIAVNNSRQRIENYLSQYALLENQDKNSQARYTLDQLRKLRDTSPEQIINLQEILLKRQLKLHQLEYKIYREYAKWLRLSELTIARPLQNHLSKDSERL